MREYTAGVLPWCAESLSGSPCPLERFEPGDEVITIEETNAVSGDLNEHGHIGLLGWLDPGTTLTIIRDDYPPSPRTGKPAPSRPVLMRSKEFGTVLIGARVVRKT